MRHKIHFEVEDFAFQELPGQKFWLDMEVELEENGCVDGSHDVTVDERKIVVCENLAGPCDYDNDLHAAVCREVVNRFNNPEPERLTYGVYMDELHRRKG